MPVTISVLYPSAPDLRFDMAYYTGSHMPMVKKLWGPHGLTGYRIKSITKTSDPNTPPPYAVECILEWGDEEQIKAAFVAGGKQIMDDIPVFSSVQPLFLIGDIVGSG